MYGLRLDQDTVELKALWVVLSCLNVYVSVLSCILLARHERTRMPRISLLVSHRAAVILCTICLRVMKRIFSEIRKKTWEEAEEIRIMKTFITYRLHFSKYWLDNHSGVVWVQISAGIPTVRTEVLVFLGPSRHMPRKSFHATPNKLQINKSRLRFTLGQLHPQESKFRWAYREEENARTSGFPSSPCPVAVTDCATSACSYHVKP